MADKTKMTSDEDIVTRVDQKVRECVGWFDSTLSKERERVLNYYNGTLPRRQNAGSSSYVSTDVYDSVESMKAQLLETFSNNSNQLVRFDARNAQDEAAAEVATAYADHVIWELNNGWALCNDVIHDGLTARVGPAKVFWEKIEERVDEEFEGISYTDVQGLVASQEVSDLEAEDQGEGNFAGKLTRVIDKSKVTIAAIPPEEFLISPRSTCVREADCVAHRTLKSKAELLDAGYDKAKVEKVSFDEAPIFTTEELARRAQIDGGAITDAAIQKELAKTVLFEAYVLMDRGEGVRRYKVCYADKVLLAIEEVDSAPFLAFVPLPIPHLFHGNNFAARVVPYQNARTVLTRAILDHASVTTNPRWTVLKGALLNPKEMLDNRLAGIVNVNRPDAVKALEYANLNPFVFQTLEMLKGNKEESTGISALSQGLNKDAISQQNSQGLVQDLVQLSQVRQKIVARNFAAFLVDLYLEVYRLALKNETKERIIRVAGKYVPVSPQDWEERSTVKVSLHLGYGDRDREAAKYMQLYHALGADPGLAPMFGLQNRFMLATDAMRAAGFSKYDQYLTRPEQTPPPQPDPLKVMEVQAKVKAADAAMLRSEAEVHKTERRSEYEQQTMMLKDLQQRFDEMMKLREADRQDADVTNRIDVSQREIALEEAAPQESANVIVSAT